MATFRTSWREAITSLSFDRGEKKGFDRGKEAGLAEGKETGRLEGLAEGQIQALFTILTTRGITVDPETRTKIETCAEPTALKRWIARAMAVHTAAELFTSESEALKRP